MTAVRKGAAAVGLVVVSILGAGLLLVILVSVAQVVATPWLALFAPAKRHNFLERITTWNPGGIHFPTIVEPHNHSQVYTLAGMAALVAAGLVFMIALARESDHWWVPDELSFPLITITLLVVWVVVSFAGMYAQAAADHPAGPHMCFSPQQHVTPLDAVYFSIGALSTSGSGGLDAHSQLCRGIAVGELAVSIPLLILALAAVGSRLVKVFEEQVVQNAVEEAAQALDELVPTQADQADLAGATPWPASTRSLIVASLRDGGTMTASEIRAATGLRRSTVSSALSKLVKDGTAARASSAYRLRKTPLPKR